jgi:hypothetical protein
MDPNIDKCDLFPFQEAVSSLNFAQMCTRPNISYTLSAAAQFAQTPKATQCTAVCKIFRYLKGTTNLGLYYSSTATPHQPITYCDADFAADITDRKSRTGYVIFLNGGPVMWNSQKQTVTATSTTEAEYVAAWAATHQVIWLRDFVNEIGYPLRQPTPLYSNNQPCIRLIRSPEVHKRTKHVDIRYHATKDAQASGIINTTYIPSAQQLVDPLTKPLPFPQFSTF